MCPAFLRSRKSAVFLPVRGIFRSEIKSISRYYNTLFWSDPNMDFPLWRQGFIHFLYNNIFIESERSRQLDIFRRSADFHRIFACFSQPTRRSGIEGSQIPRIQFKGQCLALPRLQQLRFCESRELFLRLVQFRGWSAQINLDHFLSGNRTGILNIDG